MGAVAAAEQIEMVENVIQVVQRPPLRIAGSQRQRLPIGDVKGFRETAEQFGHRQVRLAVALVNRRIEDHRLAIRRAIGIAAPKIAVQQRRSRLAADKQPVQLHPQLLALLLQNSGVAITGREVQLKPQPPLTPELDPVVAISIRLGSSADGVVTMPAETRSRLSVQRGQLPTELLHRPRPAANQRQILQYQPGLSGSDAIAYQFGHPHGSSRGEFGQTCRFGFKHGQAGSGVDLDEEGPLAIADAPRLVDAATAEGLPLAKGKGLAGDCADMTFERDPKVGHRITSRELGKAGARIGMLSPDQLKFFLISKIHQPALFCPANQEQTGKPFPLESAHADESHPISTWLVVARVS
ncbi:hypothetical protein BN874_470003 [Candidatus Contendobacter odensis Run_B_J11]|uniref:Uncharacterized protein n=1 Tax=Candidatus Contendobacter odensis Run_B_J11 TaxID=1400861 RepID=A0A7U7GDP6_9GAMM|nr:hypothetical protein BN874_470003 [Candidatus Contendobacter odensis Run_B_J11]